MSYDPSDDPRYLGGAPPRDDDDILVQTVRDGQVADALLPWATGTEWASFATYLQEQITRLTNEALNSPDYPSLAEKRGEIRALKRVASYPDNLRTMQVAALEAQAELSRLREDTLEER